MIDRNYFVMENKKSLRVNFIYSIIYQVLAIALPLITAPFVTRVLGANSLGIYSKSQALANYFLLFAMLGVNNYGNRAIARVRDNKYEVSRTFWEIYLFQVLTAIISSTLYLGYCFLFVYENRLVYIVQILYVISGLIDVNWCCFGLEKFKLTTVRSMIVRIATTIAIFLFIRSPDDLLLYTLIMSLSFILSGLAVWPFVLKNIVFVKPLWRGIRKHIKPNLFLFWPVIAISLYNIMDKLMLGWFSTNEEVAFYTYAERIVTIPTTLILALDNVIMPRMSNLYASGEKNEKIKYLMDNVMLFAMFMAAAMGFGLAGMADVFAPWFYGSAFVRCGYFILLLSPVIIVKAWAGALRTQFIIPTGRDKIYVISLTLGAIVNLLLNIFLIPRINGVGAIIGTISAEFTVCFVQFFWCRKDIDIKNYLINGFGFCVIGTIMFFCIEGLSHISSHAIVTMIVQIVCGALIYITLASIYMVRIRKNPILVNEFLKLFKIKKRFK